MDLVPWCAACDRFWSPATVGADGSCPRCGRAVEAGRARLATEAPAGNGGAAEPGDEALEPLPWHFKALLGALALYLGYRAFQGLEWLAGLL
jgi:hypothetical protein